MAISRYWRLVGICTPGNGALELSEARIYENGALADASATLSCTFAPAMGALDYLFDGLSTEVVTWHHVDYSHPGFALQWDFGIGGGVEAPWLQLGSGNAAAYPVSFIAQYSTDAVSWTTYEILNEAAYPGDFKLTSAVATVVVDPYEPNVSLLLVGNTLTDTSPSPKTVTVVGNTQVSTAQSLFGESTLYFDGAGDRLYIAPSASWVLGSTFTVDMWLYPLNLPSAGNNCRLIFIGPNANPSSFVFQIGADASVAMGVPYGGVTGVTSGAGALTLNEWRHYEFDVKDGIGTIAKHGNLIAGPVALTVPTANSGNAMYIGFETIGTVNHNYHGYMSRLRITNNVRRNDSSSFSPLSQIPGRSEFFPKAAFLNRTRTALPAPARMLPVSELPVTTAHGHLREFPFFDVYNGGIGLITGTVKEKALPANVPLRRRVLLVDERSQMVIRETWSDAVTGAYEFRGIKQGVKYTVLSYDYSNTYRAVIADNLETT